jgi:hypothetical protein
LLSKHFGQFCPSLGHLSDRQWSIPDLTWDVPDLTWSVPDLEWNEACLTWSIPGKERDEAGRLRSNPGKHTAVPWLERDPASKESSIAGKECDVAGKERAKAGKERGKACKERGSAGKERCIPCRLGPAPYRDGDEASLFPDDAGKTWSLPGLEPCSSGKDGRAHRSSENRHILFNLVRLL